MIYMYAWIVYIGGARFLESQAGKPPRRSTLSLSPTLLGDRCTDIQIYPFRLTALHPPFRYTDRAHTVKSANGGSGIASALYLG